MTTYLLAVTVDDDGADSAEHLAAHIEHVVGHNSAVYSDEDIKVSPVVTNTAALGKLIVSLRSMAAAPSTHPAWSISANLEAAGDALEAFL